MIQYTNYGSEHKAIEAKPVETAETDKTAVR